MTTRLAKILVVDGSGAGGALAASLGSQGYRVIACQRGSDALNLVQQTPPDLVIADLSLPDASGMEILLQLKAIKPEAAFISIADPETLELAVAALNEGAIAYVTKPIKLEEVYILVRNGLRQQRLLLENQRLVEKLQRSNTKLSEEIAEHKWTEEMLALVKRTSVLEVANKELEALNLAERERFQQRLQEGSRLMAVGELAADIAHELNNPLAAVMTFAHLLKLQDLPGPVAEDVAKIYSEAQRAAKVVHRILSFARSPEPEKGYIDLVDALEKALALKSHDLGVNNIEVKTEFDPDLPKTMADEYQLTQVFLNIITNAENALAGARRKGTLTISIRKVNDKIRFSLADDGPGIDPMHLHRIFEPFFTTNVAGKGTGLGLSMCRRMIQAHGGRIWVESVFGKGATFHGELPILEAAQEAAQPPPAQPRKITGKRLLIVDDEPLFAESLSRAMSEAGHVSDVARDADEAWEAIQQRAYDCVILDLKMPDTGGKELFQRLQRRKKCLAKKVIFITGDILNAKTQEFIAATGNAWLGKPFTMEALEHRVQACLAQIDPGPGR